MLNVRTSGDSTAGSTAPYAVNLTDNTWTESTLNWNNRPTTVGGLVTTITDATAVNTAYSYPASPATLNGSLGQDISLLIATGPANTDNLRLWSSEGPPTYRTTLTLTFDP